MSNYDFFNTSGKMTEKIFKAAYSHYRKQNPEIFKAFSFKHLSDVTQYYVHPNNQSYKGTTSLAQSIGEAITLFKMCYDANFLKGDELKGSEILGLGSFYKQSFEDSDEKTGYYIEVKLLSPWRENKIVDDEVYAYKATLGWNNNFCVGAYFDDGDFLSGKEKTTDYYYEYLAMFLLCLVREMDVDCEYKQLLLDYCKNPTVERFVRIHEDLYQKYKDTVFHLNYTDVKNFDVSEKNVECTSDEFERVIANRLKKQKILWSKRFFEIVKGEREIEEDKLFFGTKISSEHLGDIKKRYWKKSIVQQGSPELAILIMIDGSGSMYGERQKATINSCVILHEVLKRQEIEHCVVDYKAIYDEDKVIHNVLLDFNAKKMDCLNLLSFEPDEGTRDGISMLWAEKYIAQNSSAENKLIIVISDGVPDHFGNKAKDYYDEIAIKDSAECAKKIQQRGTKIVGVALDNNKGNNSFETLKQIYKNSIKCTDLNKLTGQLLEIIAKQIK